MWYKISPVGFWISHNVCVRQTDRRTGGQNYDSEDRTSIAASRGKNHFFYSAQLLNTDLDGGCDQHCRRPSEVYDTHRRTKLTVQEADLISSHPLHKLVVWCLRVALVKRNFCIDIHSQTETLQITTPTLRHSIFTGWMLFLTPNPESHSYQYTQSL